MIMCIDFFWTSDNVYWCVFNNVIDVLFTNNVDKINSISFISKRFDDGDKIGTTYIESNYGVVAF